MKKWMTGATVVLMMLAAFGPTALAQRDAVSRDRGPSPSAQQDVPPREDAQAPSTRQGEARLESGVKTFVPPDLGWEDNPDVSGVQNAAGVGDPTRPELYTNFGRLDEGVRFPAHTHPDARITTVLAGTMYYGVGEQFGEAEPYPAGSVIYTPPDVPHVMWAKSGEIIVQETGRGPTDLEFTSSAQR